jgi:hypothetical protein
MLALIVAQTLLMSGSCQERCAADTNRCYSGCGSSKSCNHHCDDRATDCGAQCAKGQANAEAATKAKRPEMPCDVRPNRSGNRTEYHPCSESEAKMFKDALNSPEAKKALKCKNAKGQPMPCKDDMAKEKEIVKDVGRDGLCADANGTPRVCADAQKKVEKTLKK